MENFKCLNCGKEMDFIGIDLVDTNHQEREILVVEKWECLECGKMEKFEVSGKITGTCRNC